MSYKFEEGKDLIIDAVVNKIMQKMTADQATSCAEFVRQFFSTVAIDDLCEWDIEDLYGAAINFWSFIQHRDPNETKIRIYNPDFERHGWQTTHTVIEIIMEDMPFLVDSLRLVINRLGLSSHLIIQMGGLNVIRDKHHQVVEVLPKNKHSSKALIEAPIFIEIDRLTDVKKLEALNQEIESVVEDNRAVVEDWPAMRSKVREAIDELKNASKLGLDPDEVKETIAFFEWIEDHHFTFLGIRDYEIVQTGQEMILQPIDKTGLGILRPSISQSNVRSITAMNPQARERTLSNAELVMLVKTTKVARVHRNAPTDLISLKRLNSKGEVIGERRIIGLYTSAAYNTSPRHIPFLRLKVARVMKNSELDPRSHAGKILLNIIETLPRDDLIQAQPDELLEICMGIYYMQDRRKIRLFARKDAYRRFISCLVYVPKERFNTEMREAMEAILMESLHGESITFSTWFSESIFARIHFIVKTNPQNDADWDFKEIERKLVDIGRSWTDELQHFLSETFGEEQANRLFVKYKDAFPIAYRDTFQPRTAVYDVKHIEHLSAQNPLVMNFYRPLDEPADSFRLKIYQHDDTIPLSDVLPIVERLGMRAISERPYEIKYEDGKTSWINDFALQYTKGECFEIDEIKDLFQNAFASVWFGYAENDGFNQLIMSAGLNWRQVSVLRAYAKYFKQIGITFSQEYIESALENNPTIARKLIKLFDLRFNPHINHDREVLFTEKVEQILTALDEVSNLDEDKIIRLYIHAISSSLRTNYFQFDASGEPKTYLSIKLNSRKIPGVPKPYPMFEIFVYSPRFEGVHLRGGKVARGGLRWSDRREDFRTEILGLMKAQQVKNAVIVPSGAKGGFVPKRMPVNASREEIMTEGIACYQEFIRSLLDITDNYRGAEIIKPAEVVCYDEDDPYLVVAADKGTATFSDIANAISLEYRFWLGDAFASGGSVGYDHKKMGITARGAWESVKRHFYEMGRDIQNRDFTTVGIGDMAGDVFGNGMLLSRHTKLLAAFNHVHIFVDPDPDPEISFVERERLFHLPRSTWMDYDRKCMSAGGGVFNRNAKSIPVSKEMKRIFDIKQDEIEPNQLIQVILRAKVDLLWSAGIGTFVKAKTETHLDVGDRTNDAIRIDGSQLRCKVVGEGGNLGLTQLARVEYSLNGGLIYTDFIDNSAGVSCSDKEVNIKILLDSIIATGDLTFKQRNELLSEMTEEVAALVLRDNFAQPRSISFTAANAVKTVELHIRYINELERTGKIDRSLEYIPEEKVLLERKMMGKGLTRPSIALLQSYSKTILKEDILESNVPEDSYLKQLLVTYFPVPLQERFVEEMQQHPLRREIVATRLSNTIVNEMGLAFVYRMRDETGAPVSAIVRAYIIARTILNIDSLWHQIEQLEEILTADKQTELAMLYVRLLRRITRWLLRTQRLRLNINNAIKRYSSGIGELKTALPAVLGEHSKVQFNEHYEEYLALGIAPELAHELTSTRAMFAVMDVIEIAHQMDLSVGKVAEVYYGIGEYLDLSWIRSQVIAHPTESNWESLSREALRDDLDLQQRQLTAGILSMGDKQKDFMKSLAVWSEAHGGLIERWHQILGELRSSNSLNYTMFFVAIRELLDLTQTTLQMSEKEAV